MKKRDEIKKIKKSKIHKSALALFSQKGYFQTSMADISREAKISKGLFYHYYSGKEELFEDIILESIESIMNYFPENNDQEFNDEKLLYYTNNIILPSLDKDKSHWKLLILLLSQQILYEIATRYLAKSTAYIEYENILSRYFKTKGYEKPDVEVKLFTASLMGICIQYIINPSDFPIKVVMEEFTYKIISKGQLKRKVIKP
jgi:AcrR family transcriptional regulator